MQVITRHLLHSSVQPLFFFIYGFLIFLIFHPPKRGEVREEGETQGRRRAKEQGEACANTFSKTSSYRPNTL